MAHHSHSSSDTACPTCECQPFSRNAYWTGKLMLARDFADEQQYVVDKLRHHNQHLHGTGVVCGLQVVPHPNKECQKYFICVEPGSAIDCCGRDLVLCERECIDLRTFPEIKKVLDDPKAKSHALRICLKYRECPTEDIPVLYDECGCDDARCAPNRILESHEIVVELLPQLPDPPKPAVEGHCCEMWTKLACHNCDDAEDCVVLATIRTWVPGTPIGSGSDASVFETPSSPIDNVTFRQIVPSVQAIKEFLDCLKLCEPGGGGGEGKKGQDGKDGADGKDGTDGKDGQNGDPGPGLEAGLTRIKALSWTHEVPSAKARPNQLAKIDMKALGGQRSQFGVVIAFTDKVSAESVDAAHVFQVLVDHTQEDPDRLPLRCRCPIEGKVIAVEVTRSPAGVITDARATKDPTPEALAFIFDSGDDRMPPDKVVELLRERNRELWIVLRCDFVIDTNGKAVDGEHVRGTLLSGDRPKAGDPGSEFGIQGGLFESWFTVGPRG